MRKGILNRISYKAKRSKNRGFTLVELIVVLVVLAIVASIGIVSGVSYINRSRFDKNQQHAVSVYQAAQTAVSNKVMNGSIDEWVRSSGLSSLVNTDDLDVVNESAHNTSLAYLTYNPKGSAEGNKLYELLSDYFYDRSVFTGTMSVVFDVVATHDGHSEKFSVNIKAAFYSKENSASSGWDSRCTAGSENELPNTDFGYRSKTSHVGYFNGTEASVVGPVNLPTNTSTDMLNAIFTLRNGETLDLTWSFFDKDPEHKAVMKVNLKNADDENEEPVVLTIDETKFICDEYGNTETINMADGTFLPNSTKLSNIVESYEQIWMSGAPLDITKKTKYGLAKVNVKKSASDAGTDYIFPLAISEVQGDAQARYPDGYNNNKEAKYTSYTITLDSIINRSDLAKSDDTRRYTSERLFGKTPKNIIANLEEATNLTIPLNNIDALRAVNDPVYFKEFKKYLNDNPTYFYNPKISNAARDTDKLCVANTLFGDIHYVGTKDKVDGTTVDAANGIDAAITSFRHLSNIRMIAEGTKAHYKIAKDLDWYTELDGKYYTEVRVFTDLDPTGRFTTQNNNTVVCNKLGRFHSPAMNGNLYVVSFPAIHELYNNQTLSSLSYVSGNDESDTVFSINNLQMRWLSFRTQHIDNLPGITIDEGFGLFGKNSGKIYNIYTNNLNLTLENKRDGTAKDNSGGSNNNSSFSPSGNITVTQSADENEHLGNRPVGGLVGINEGSLGDANADESSNTICMSNCMILGGKYWQLTKNITDGSGGVVGKNTGNTNGLMKVCGKFAVTGTSKVGGIIGYSTAAKIGAKLVVDGSASKYGTPVITLPKLKVFDNTSRAVSLDCAVIGLHNEGGAIGYVENAEFTYASGVSGRSFNEKNGTLKFASDYQIDVKLPVNGFIGSPLAPTEANGIGGAIGYADGLIGDYISIKVVNYGNILSTNIAENSNNQYGRVGGAIGMSEDATTKNTYIDVVNGTDSKIGSDTVGKKGPGASGGAIGRIDGYSDKLNINIQNNGLIFAYCPKDKDEACGAGGAVGSVHCSPKANINVYNADSTKANIYANNPNEGSYAGTGGAVGSWLGKTDYLTINSNSRIFVLNKFNISAVRNVGGAIGCAGDNEGNVYAVNNGITISGSSDFVGGVVGKSRYQNSGLYQATFTNGAGVKGKDFVGGAAGSLTKLTDNGVTKVVISDGTSKVEGTKNGNNGGYYVGGVCGEALRDESSTNGTGSIVLVGGNNDKAELNVVGRNSVGGSVGVIRGDSDKTYKDIAGVITMPTQKSGNRLIVNVEGDNDVGGAIGRMFWASMDNVNTRSTLSDISAAGAGNAKINLSLVVRPESHIKASSSNAGGVVGRIWGAEGSEYTGELNIKTVTGTGSTNSGVSGGSNVGGAVGLIQNNCIIYVKNNATRKLAVDFSASAYNIRATGTSANSNAGGAVGNYTGKTSNKSAQIVPIEVKLGASNISATNSNVGGAIGKTDYTDGVNTDVVFKQQIKVDTTGAIEGKDNIGGIIGYNQSNMINLDATVKESGSVTGTGSCVGGVIGLNECNKVESVNCAINGNISGVNNVGGAIGYSKSKITKTVTAVVKGTINATGESAGGAIGMSFNSDKSIKIENINATITDKGNVTGIKFVGGAIGQSKQEAKDIKAEIRGRAYISGEECIGGAIGLVTGNQDKYGNITNEVSAVISSERALRGTKCIGGAIGQLADKKVDAWPRIKTVTAEINAGILYEQVTDVDAEFDACIGSVVGFYSDSNVKKLVLKGTGGTVNPGHPNRYFSNCILIRASGRSIGGICGQVGTEGYQTNARVIAIDASQAPGLCVVSNNGSDRVGGWIGAGFGSTCGIAGRQEPKEIYEVNNVKVVYSTGSEVGGFMGRADGTNCENKKIDQEHCIAKADINVTLKNASVSGKSRVGGAIGYFCLGGLREGSVTVNLTDHSTVGDFSTDEPLCYNAGGAIGDVSMAYRGNTNWDRFSCIRVPITVNIDSTSKVYAGSTEKPAESSEMQLDYAGVGGAIGRIGRKDNNGDYNYHSVQYDKSPAVDFKLDNARIFPMEFTQLITVNSTNPEVSVYSASTNAGGVVGLILDGTIRQATSNAIVYSKGTGHYAVAAGGFAGRIEKGTIESVSVYGKNNKYVSVSDSEASAGGFAGRVEGGSITNSFSTYTVKSNGRYTGGFVGIMNGGTITNAYIGGHTVERQYESGKGNVTGVENVGGFVGILNSNSATITNCYTTASVRGQGDNIGGFAGLISAGKISSSYTTSRVVNTVSGNTGAFAGKVLLENDDMFSGNQSLMGISPNLNLIGKAEPDQPVTGIELASQETIKGSHNDNATPDDAALGNKFKFRAVIGTMHYGDWPEVSSGSKSLEDALVELFDKDGPTAPADIFTYIKGGVTFADYDPDLAANRIRVSIAGGQLTLGTDYVLTYRYNDVVSPTDEQGEVTRYAEVIISAKFGSDYTGTVTKRFTIVPVDIAPAEVTLSTTPLEYDYTGASVSEYIKDEDITVVLNGETLIRNIDYYLEYTDSDGKDASAYRDCGTYNVIVKGMGNYTGMATQVVSFTINGASLLNADIMLIDKTETGPDEYEHTYTGESLKPVGEDIVVRLGGETLVEDSGYEVAYAPEGSNFIDVGTYTITITGIKNYKDSRTLTLKIIQATNSWKYVPQIDDCFYGEAPGVTCEPMFGKDTIEYHYYSDPECTVEVDDIKTADVGTYYIKLFIPETENYSSLEYVTDIEVQPKQITEDMINLPENIVYDGTAKTPATVTYNGKTLVEGTDYSIQYTDNVNAGTATVTVTGMHNFATTPVSKTFVIAPAPITADMITVGSAVYTGEPQTPAVTVKFKGKTLVAGTDYEVVGYENNTNAGNATVTVTGKGNFDATEVAKTFTIQAKKLTDDMVTLASDTEPYTGSEIKPAVTVKDGETTLVEGTDYTVTYTDNVEPGIAKVAVAGIGNYKDTINKTFTITPPENPDNGNEGGNSEGGNEGSNTEGGNNEGGNSGGNAEGGNNEGGNSEGGNAGGNEGGNTEGGNTSGGSNEGGNTEGGNTSGGNAEGGNAGGSTEGGNNTSGGNSTEGNGKSANADKPADSDKSSEAAKPAETPKQDETPKTAETPKEDNTKTADNTKSAAPKTADTTKDTEPAKTTEAPKTAETTKAPESTKSSEKPKTTESTKSSEKPKTVESTKAADTTKDADTAKDAKETKATESTKTTEKPKSKKKSEDSEPKTTSKPKETEAAKSGETEAKTDNN